MINLAEIFRRLQPKLEPKKYTYIPGENLFADLVQGFHNPVPVKRDELPLAAPGEGETQKQQETRYESKYKKDCMQLGYSPREIKPFLEPEDDKLDERSHGGPNE